MTPRILLRAAAAAFCLAGAALAQTAPATPPAETAAEPWLVTLRTETPQEGFALALSLARHAVKATQPDMAVLKAGRPDYATDPARLIDASGVVAQWFATVAAANDYWREGAP